MQEQTPAVYRVGDLIIDVGLARVERGGQEIPLPKLSFDLLLALIDEAPRLVSLDSLMAKVWSGLVVSPETVSQRVKLLRSALGDDAAKPKYIVGVRSRGYRVLAEVRRPEIAKPKPADPPDAPHPPVNVPEAVASKPRPWRAVAAILALGLTGMLALLFWPARVADHGPPATPPSRAAPAPAARSIAVLPFENLGTTPANNILALGIPETILHQLASLRDLTVIARTSSFAFKDKNTDAREIGRQLNVHYLLEGSVQSEKPKLRITAQLIDTTTGAHIWSMRFDNAQRDVFSVQDEIALAVAKALKLSVDSNVADQLQGQGTANFEAYLAYLEGRALMQETRVVGLQAAVQHFEAAIRMDANFAPAYLALADASLQAAEYEMTNKREARVREAMRRGRDLVERALKLDPGDGAAYVTRARLESFTDAAAAEGDYRRGLQLSPNHPAAYEGLASLLAETPARGAEALALLNRVHELDPLEPRYEVMRAEFLHFRLGKWREASKLLEGVIAIHPVYSPALTHLALIRQSEGRFAETIRLLEQSLELDPQAEWTRRVLIRTYLEYEDLQAVQSVIDEAPTSIAARQIPLFLARHDWRKAGEAAYEGIATGTLTVYDESPVACALQKHALVTGEYTRARDALQKLAGVSWDAAGHPRRDAPPDIQMALVGLAAVMQIMHEPVRAAALIELQHQEQQNSTQEFAESWYVFADAEMLALAGKADAAIVLVARHRNIALENAQYDFDINPAFDTIRNTPKFQQVKREWLARMQPQKALLAKYRAEGLVPDRTVD